jgi:ketosteroid isomerase-like protein
LSFPENAFGSSAGPPAAYALHFDLRQPVFREPPYVVLQTNGRGKGAGARSPFENFPRALRASAGTSVRADWRSFHAGSHGKEAMMTIQENKKLVMQGYQKFQAQDIEGLMANLADDIDWIGVESEYLPFSGIYHGKQEVMRYFSMLAQAQDVVRFEPIEMIAEGDKVVVSGESEWTVRATGRSYVNPWVHIFTIRDGKVARFQQFNDTAAAERAYRPLQASTGQQPGTGASILH